MAYSSMTPSYKADVSLKETCLLFHNYNQLQTPTNSTSNWIFFFLNIMVNSHSQLSVQINIGKNIDSPGSTAKLVLKAQII